VIRDHLRPSFTFHHPSLSSVRRSRARQSSSPRARSLARLRSPFQTSSPHPRISGAVARCVSRSTPSSIFVITRPYVNHSSLCASFRFQSAIRRESIVVVRARSAPSRPSSFVALLVAVFARTSISPIINCDNYRRLASMPVALRRRTPRTVVIRIRTPRVFVTSRRPAIDRSIDRFVEDENRTSAHDVRDQWVKSKTPRARRREKRSDEARRSMRARGRRARERGEDQSHRLRRRRRERGESNDIEWIEGTTNRGK